MSLHRIALTRCWIVGGFLLCAATIATGAPQSSESAPSRSGAPKDSGDKETTFTYAGGKGEMDTAYGVRLGFTDFTASDGIGLRVFFLAQDNPFEAATAFKEEVARAVKVFEVGDKKDAKGKIVGKRALILVRSSKPKPPFPAVIWTDGPTFHEIASSSMGDNVALEKIYRH